MPSPLPLSQPQIYPPSPTFSNALLPARLFASPHSRDPGGLSRPPGGGVGEVPTHRQSRPPINSCPSPACLPAYLLLSVGTPSEVTPPLPWKPPLRRTPVSSTEPMRSCADTGWPCAAPVGPELSLEAHTSTDWQRGLLRASFPSSLHRWSGACLAPSEGQGCPQVAGGGGLVHCCLSANHHVTAFAALSQSKKWERGQIGQGPRVQPLTVTTVLLATDSDWQLVCPGKRWVQDRGS